MSKFIDRASEFLAARKGLLPLVGVILILANLFLQFSAPAAWLTHSNLLLHIGIIIAILGVMLAWAL